MIDRQLLQFFSMVETNIGISLDQTKRYLLESRLGPILSQNGFADLGDLITHLNRTAVGPMHWQAFEALTTNETMFFRDPHVFETIRRTILPRLIETNRPKRSLKIWSAAVSTGQEAYSIAMLIREYFPELDAWNVTIDGTDISRQIIEKASGGIYNAKEIARGLNATFQGKYFQQIQGEQFALKPTIKNMVRFKVMNLTQPWPLMPEYDLVLLRNVMIYFSQDTRDRLLAKIHERMKTESSILLLGSAETLLGNPLYKIVHQDRVSFYVPLPKGNL